MIATAAYIYGAAIGAWPLNFTPIALCVIADWMWAGILTPDFS